MNKNFETEKKIYLKVKQTLFEMESIVLNHILLRKEELLKTLPDDIVKKYGNKIGAEFSSDIINAIVIAIAGGFLHNGFPSGWVERQVNYVYHSPKEINLSIFNKIAERFVSDHSDLTEVELENIYKESSTRSQKYL